MCLSGISCNWVYLRIPKLLVHLHELHEGLLRFDVVIAKALQPHDCEGKALRI